MTTIVATLDRMCADSRCNLGDGVFTTTPKIFEVRGALIGTAGDFGVGERFMDWYGTGRVIPKVRVGKKETFEALVLTPAGLFLYGDDWSPIPIADGVFAIGTGGHSALAALRGFNSTPERAVEVACLIDTNSAPPVQCKLIADVKPHRARKAAQRKGE